ncbi:MAG: hypothetical protein HY774_00945 [Acidobacteria bacterium]|nr:hypothetical protein [Acidobacteriota bacterium]
MFEVSSKIKSFALLLLIVCCATTVALSQNRQKYGKNIKLFYGENGIQVVAVQVGSPENNEFLVKISGDDFPLNGVIEKHKLVDTSSSATSRLDYVKKVNGEDYTTMYFRNGNGWVYIVNAAGEGREYRVYGPETINDEESAKSLYLEYLGQQEDASNTN